MTTMPEEVYCKFCHSKNVIRYGIHKNIQCCWCKDCRRKFTNNHALPRMKVALRIAGTAVGYYFEGKSAHIIIQDVLNKFGIYVSEASLYEWVDKFSHLGAEAYRTYQPEVGDIWMVNGTRVNVCGDRYRIIDVIDTQTKFIITTMFFSCLSIDTFNQLIESAKERAGKIPKKIIILSDRCNLDRSMFEDGIRYRGIDIIVLDEVRSRMLTKHFENVFQTRNQILSRLKKKENINKIIFGWLMHYNYHRKNKYLNYKTPSEKANIVFNPFIAPSLSRKLY